ncbi:MAG: PQQ-binding-like beta-propeller repeat protein [Thermoanaerobaculia bacterium]|nr:PQQ-binding-like beta-propeller repeat protein [Thermoanaerobaculia bacterium]
MNETPDRSRPPVRWWPAVAILAVVLGLLGWFWLGPAPQTQQRVIATFPTLFFGAVALFLWLVLFSRLPGRLRARIFLVTLLVVAAGFLLFEIQGVDGNLVPILGYRWSGERDFEVTASADDGAMEAVETLTDYPQFYGPRRDATLDGPRLARDWQADPPREIWRREVGEGWSAFAIAGQAAVTQEQRGGRELVVRYDLATGAEEWVHADDTSFDTTVGGKGPRATPTIDRGRVYTLGATGILNCLELDSGRRVWSRDVLADTGTAQPDWGLPSSPLVTDDLVIVEVGRGGPSLAAYDRDTGEPVWTVDSDSGSYSTPRLAVVGGRQQVLVVNQRSVAGHDPATGRRLWSIPWDTGGEKVTPVLPLSEDLVLVSAGYGQGSRLLRLLPEDPQGSSYRVEEVWESRRLKSKFAPMVVHEGVVYGLDDGVMVALDPETGERLWKAGRYGHGQLILVGELILVTTEKGDVVLVEATPEEHRELGRFEAFDSKTWNPPALAGNLLLIRNNREAAAYELPLAG